jgi:hypothetical protein
MTFEDTLCSYGVSVMEAADQDGFLSTADAVKLVTDHGISEDVWLQETRGTRSASALLMWLGY